MTGLVGAAGGLGGYFPPLVLGATYGKVFDHYGFGLMLLCLVALAALVFALVGVKDARDQQARTTDATA